MILQEKERFKLNEIKNILNEKNFDAAKFAQHLDKNKAELVNYESDILFLCYINQKFDALKIAFDKGFQANQQLHDLIVPTCNLFLEIDKLTDLTNIVLADGNLEAFKLIEKNSNIDKKELFTNCMYYFYQWAKVKEFYSQKSLPIEYSIDDIKCGQEISTLGLKGCKDILKYLSNEYKLSMDTHYEKYNKTLGEIATKFEKAFESKTKKSKKYDLEKL